MVFGIALLAFIGFKYIHRAPDFKALWIERIGGTNALALSQIITGEEPYVLTFLIPLNLEVKTYENGYKSSNDCWFGVSDNGRFTDGVFSTRSNGNYRIRFQTSFSPRGENHVYKLALVTPFHKLFGPPITVSYTNLFKLDAENLFGDGGVRFRFNLGVDWVSYKINIYDTNRNLLNLIMGQTTNGTIDELWKFNAMNGETRTDDEFYAEFYISHLRTGTNGDAIDGIFIPTNPCPYNYLRDKSNRVSR